jgi:hypothetical protein
MSSKGSSGLRPQELTPATDDRWREGPGLDPTRAFCAGLSHHRLRPVPIADLLQQAVMVRNPGFRGVSLKVAQAPGSPLLTEPVVLPGKSELVEGPRFEVIGLSACCVRPRGGL